MAFNQLTGALQCKHLKSISNFLSTLLTNNIFPDTFISKTNFNEYMRQDFIKSLFFDLGNGENNILDKPFKILHCFIVIASTYLQNGFDHRLLE